MKIKLSLIVLLLSVILTACAPTGTTVSPEVVIPNSITESAPTNTAIPTSTITPAPSLVMPQLSVPYLGQEPPGMEPKVFAPGIVSIPGFTEFSGAFSPDGSEYYFYRWSEDSITTLLSTKVVDGKWTAPEQLAITAGYDTFLPFVTLDNKWLYFAWRHPVPEGQPGFPSYFVAERTENGWSEPKYAGQGMFLSSTRGGQLYTTDMSARDRTRQTYLAKVETDNGIFVNLERLPIEVRSGSQAHPCIALDENYILFDVNGGSYLYVSFKNADGTWGEAIDLTKHGFDPLAGGATISPDGKYLFFALRDDIWWVDITVIENLKPVE